MRTIEDFLKVNGHTLWSVTPDSSVKNAMKLMANKQVGALPVLEAEKLVGIISEKDCIEKVVLWGISTDKKQVREVMVQSMIFTIPTQTLEECLTLMTEKQIQYLPVMASDSLVGFVSENDLLGMLIADQHDYIYRLENYVLGIGFT